MTLPGWLLEILVEQMERLEAEDLEKAMVAASTPYLSEHTRRSLLRQLKARSGSRRKADPPAVVEENPEKAREWFKALGAQVN